MQKLPKFGERTKSPDIDKETQAFSKLEEFLTRKSPVKNVTTCAFENDWEMLKLEKDPNGLHTKYGRHWKNAHFLSPEEAFFLSTRKVLEASPTLILMHSQILIQKIFLYSYLKRKGGEVSVENTSLVQSMAENFGCVRKIPKKGKCSLVKSADEVVELEIGDTFIESDGVFEKIRISKWDARPN